jgi:hypothetical protein
LYNLLSVKIETCLNSCIGNGTFELRYRTAELYSKGYSQRVYIPDIASRISYSK